MPVVVEGLSDLQKAFRVADKSAQRELRASLKKVVEPVRQDAERLAVAGIPRVGLPWSRMRVGVTTRTVYVAPKQRGSRHQERRRPNFAGLLLERSMLPALRANEREVMVEMDRMLGEVGRDWERV